MKGHVLSTKRFLSRDLPSVNKILRSEPQRYNLTFGAVPFEPKERETHTTETPTAKTP